MHSSLVNRVNQENQGNQESRKSRGNQRFEWTRLNVTFWRSQRRWSTSTHSHWSGLRRNPMARMTDRWLAMIQIRRWWGKVREFQKLLSPSWTSSLAVSDQSVSRSRWLTPFISRTCIPSWCAGTNWLSIHRRRARGGSL